MGAGWPTRSYKPTTRGAGALKAGRVATHRRVEEGALLAARRGEGALERTRAPTPIQPRGGLILSGGARVAHSGARQVSGHGRLAESDSPLARLKGVCHIPQGQAKASDRSETRQPPYALADVPLREPHFAATNDQERRLDGGVRPHGRVPPRPIPRGLCALLHVRHRDARWGGVFQHTGAQLRVDAYLSPAIFTEIMAAPTAYIRNPAVATRPRFGLRTALHSAHSGTRTLPWLDDFAHFMPSCLSYEQACDRRDAIAAIYDRLGLRRAPDKGQWNPSHVLEEHLGFCIDSSRGLFLLTSRRERALAHGAHALLRQAALKQGRVRTRELASFAGLGESSSLALPLGRFMLRALYDDLASRRGWGGSVSLSRQTREDLRWWTALRGSPHVGRAIWRPPESRELWCDASDLGWGGALAQRLRLAPAAGFWSPDELPWHITRKELVAVRLTVHHFLPQLAGRRVLLHEDNQAVVWILTNFVSRSSELMHELRKLWYLLDNYDIALRPVYIRSAENRIADAASRLACSRDYVISRARFESVQRAWGWCTVDAFASSATAQLPRYWTPAAGIGGEAIDAFAQDWRGERLWLHPPPSMIPATVQMLQSSGAEAHVCVPHWAGAAWFGMLRELASESVSFPPGTLRAIAGDAPKRLCSWPVTIFRIAAAATS